MLAPILQSLAQPPYGEGIAGLGRLVAALRPPKGAGPEQAAANVTMLADLLERDDALRAGFQQYLLAVLRPRRKVHLFSDTGILDNLGFGETLRRRLAYKVLPPAVNDAYLKDVVGQLFYHPNDHAWVAAVDDELWFRLFGALTQGFQGDTGMHDALYEALRILSYRVATIGLEPELVRNHPDIERHESPFLRQNEVILALLAARMQGGDNGAAREAEVLLEQCREVAERVAKQATRSGVSISLTFLLQRLNQSLARMTTLLAIVSPTNAGAGLVAVQLFKDLIEADAHKYSLRHVFATNIDLIALRVTDNASKTGDHYVTSNRAEYLAMARSALGAGFVVSFMALLKILAAKLKLAPIGEALTYGLNYSLGFMFIHLVHFTVATKQPAMTAATIAASLGQAGQSRRDMAEALEGVAELTRDVFRTQFIAILGNIALAFPMAVLLGTLIHTYGSGHVVTPAKAAYLLAQIDVLSTPALFYAAIAGVCLFLSGLISGYYDNKAAYAQVPERLRQLRWLRKLIGVKNLTRLADYIDDNLGALAGNFFFGLMLGGMPTLGFLLGLPLDIRHITFSAANLGFAFVALDWHISGPLMARMAVGIAGIGLTNLAVSFGLALWVALRSRGVRYRSWLPLTKILLTKFVRQPSAFFWPPKPRAETKPEHSEAAPV